VVTLLGKMASQAQCEAAERVARRAEGLKTLVNRLTVRPAEDVAHETAPPDLRPG
jgi:osmotically-inducible protein OsmY